MDRHLIISSTTIVAFCRMTPAHIRCTVMRSDGRSIIRLHGPNVTRSRALNHDVMEHRHTVERLALIIPQT